LRPRGPRRRGRLLPGRRLQDPGHGPGGLGAQPGGRHRRHADRRQRGRAHQVLGRVLGVLAASAPPARGPRETQSPPAPPAGFLLRCYTTGTMPTEVHFRRDGAVASLTLASADGLHVLSRETLAALRAHLDALAPDPEL